MSFGSQSIRCAPMPGASTSPTAPSVRPIGLFLGSAVAASSRHSRNGEGRFKATMGFAVISDHWVNAREANRSSRAKTGWKVIQETKAIANGVPGIALRGDSARIEDQKFRWLQSGKLFDRRVHGNYRRARSCRPLTRCFDGKSIASLISSLRLVLVSSDVELFQLSVCRLL